MPWTLEWKSVALENTSSKVFKPITAKFDIRDEVRLLRLLVGFHRRMLIMPL